MKTKELIKEIKGVFLPPKKTYYFGKTAYGSPYFYPRNFLSTIIAVRKLRLKTEEEKVKIPKSLLDKPGNKFSNYPIYQRTKMTILNIFGTYFLLSIGFPIMVSSNTLGWKDKFNTPRFEFAPSFHIYFFGLQFSIFWNSPDGNNDRYYEMILHWLYYADKDIKKAEETWGWVDFNTKKSTWDNNFLQNQNNS